MNQKRVIRVIVAIFVVVSLISFIRGWTSPGKKETIHSLKNEFLDELAKSDWKQFGVKYQTNKLARLPSDASVREQLSFNFPYEEHKPIPKSIWQTWKVSPDHSDFPMKFTSFIKSWRENNPDYTHVVLSDSECDKWVAQVYLAVPLVAESYLAMPKTILKADFFRYLVLFARGGVYSDIDTINLKPIDTWASMQSLLNGKSINPGLVVGIEADPDRPDWAEYYARRIQFCQWTIQAKKGHPALRDIIANIANITLWRKKRGNLLKTIGKDTGDDIMNWTGPGIWTDTVFGYMNSLLRSETEQSRNIDVIDWKVFTGMEEPIPVEDLLVLPITSFSPDVGHMGSKSVSDPMAYVDHDFLGVWKKDEPRE